MSNKLIKQPKKEQKQKRKKRSIEPRLVVSGVISVVLFMLAALLLSGGLGIWNALRDGKRKNMVGWMLPATGIFCCRYL